MDQERKRLYYIIGGSAAAVLVVVLLLILLLGGGKNKTYQKYYDAAEHAYLTQDYDAALDSLGKALEAKDTEDAYLLMADIYYAQGDTERAIQVLSLGSARLGGKRIADMLTRLRADADNDPAAQPAPEGEVTIAGVTVEGDATSLVLANRALSAADLKTIGSLTKLESLSISGCGVESIAALSDLRKLTSLQISGNNLRDLSPLAGLSALKTLYIDDNPVEDFTPLYALQNLRTLSMKGIAVTETALSALKSALSNCAVYADAPSSEAVEVTLGGRKFQTDVTELNLGGLGIQDVSILSECKHLKKLDLRDNRITDISPLLDLQELEWLCLWNNDVTDINPLMSLSALRYLDVDGNEISDITVLRNLTGLEELWLNHNPIKSLDPLKGLTGLTRLGLEDTGIDDAQLDALMGLTQLRELNIKGNEDLSAGKFEALQEALTACTIAHDELRYTVTFGDQTFESDAEIINAPAANVSDLGGLEKFSRLRILKLYGNKISDLSPLRGIETLEELWLYGNQISDLSPLGGLPALNYLDLQSNAVRDLSPLAGCGHLRTLLLSDNQVSDLMPISACTEMTVLDLDNNDITDISALAPLTSLSTLHLENNHISDLSALYSLVNLETLYIRGNELVPDDILALQTMLPNCLVIHDVDMSQAEENPAPTESPAPIGDEPGNDAGTVSPASGSTAP